MGKDVPGAVTNADVVPEGPSRLIVGAMSGTSADGVDVAIVRITGRGLGMAARLLHHRHEPYRPSLRQTILQVREAGVVDLAILARLGRDISLAYADAVNAALSASGLKSADVAAVAAHGQTLYHDPPDTIQWLDPALIAANVGCPVVSDFRRADCAAGGQGAPLVPFADYLLFRDLERNRVLLNIGGIANLTLIPRGVGLDTIRAFDCGPGNCVSDWLMRKREPGGAGIDVGGERASRGNSVGQIVSRAMSDPFFESTPPKSTDVPQMIRLFREAAAQVEAVAGPDATDDLLATACCFTACAVEHGIGLVYGWVKGEYELIASGGGVCNAAIMGWLSELLGPENIRTSQSLGIPAETKEAVAFALLGAATLDGEPSNIPSVTGARRPVVLGSITPKP